MMYLFKQINKVREKDMIKVLKCEHCGQTQNITGKTFYDGMEVFCKGCEHTAFVSAINELEGYEEIVVDGFDNLCIGVDVANDSDRVAYTYQMI